MMITLVKRRKNKTELHLNLVQIKKNILGSRLSASFNLKGRSENLKSLSAVD